MQFITNIYNLLLVNKKTQIETSREDLSIDSENESLLEEVRITESTRNEENTFILLRY